MENCRIIHGNVVELGFELGFFSTDFIGNSTEKGVQKNFVKIDEEKLFKAVRRTPDNGKSCKVR